MHPPHENEASPGFTTLAERHTVMMQVTHRARESVAMNDASERVDEIDTTRMQITMVGRDDQGVQLASPVLADAFVRSGCCVQALEVRRDGREGTVRAALWVGNRHIRRRCE